MKIALRWLMIISCFGAVAWEGEEKPVDGRKFLRATQRALKRYRFEGVSNIQRSRGKMRLIEKRIREELKPSKIDLDVLDMFSMVDELASPAARYEFRVRFHEMQQVSRKAVKAILVESIWQPIERKWRLYLTDEEEKEWKKDEKKREGLETTAKRRKEEAEDIVLSFIVPYDNRETLEAARERGWFRVSGIIADWTFKGWVGSEHRLPQLRRIWLENAEVELLAE
ncbi:MAG: hypothetical protein AB7N71_07105 [Phycisphaerae bacterium]